MADSDERSDARSDAEEEEEVEYVFVSLEGLPKAAESLASGAELLIEGLLTEAPRVEVGGRAYRAAFDEDIGSTMFFNCSSLKRVADVKEREASDLTLLRQEKLEDPLVCVTSKRLCLHRPA